MEVKDSAGASVVKYAYDALRRRVREIRGDKTTYLYYDGPRVFAEYEKSGSQSTAALARYFIDGPMYVDEHVLLHEGGNGVGQGRDYVYLLGPLYRVAGLADPYGNVVQAYPYDAFGTIAATAPPAPTVEAAGCRYLKVVLPNITEAVAIRVQKLVNGVASGEGWYAGPTFVPTGYPAHQPLDHRHARLCDSAASVVEYRTPAQWDNTGGRTVYVSGTLIEPKTSYRVQLETKSGVRAASDDATTPWWGQVVEPGAWAEDKPDAVDITRIMDSFKAKPGAPPFEAANLSGTCAAGVDHVIDAIDIVMVVDAFKGLPYPCTTPPTCTSGATVPQNPYRFTGRRLDLDFRDAAGRPLLTLYDYRAREYDAKNGRFLQRDPAGYVDGMNLYEAFKNNPLRWVDPFGAKNTAAYQRDKASHDQWYADFMDMLGVYDVTPETNALADDAINLVKELSGRRQLIKELGGQIGAGIEIVGAFNDGADLAIVLNEWGEGKVYASQFAVLLPFIGNGHIKLLNKCKKELAVLKGTGPAKLSTIVPVRELRRLLGNAIKGDKEIHHLIEQRFHPVLGINNADDVEGVLISALEHRGVRPKDLADGIDEQLRKSNLTQMFRDEVPYRAPGDVDHYGRFTAQRIYDAHRRVYARFGVSDLTDVIKKWFEPFGVDFNKVLE